VGSGCVEDLEISLIDITGNSISINPAILNLENWLTK
jgi:hypothetical protein